MLIIYDLNFCLRWIPFTVSRKNKHENKLIVNGSFKRFAPVHLFILSYFYNSQHLIFIFTVVFLIEVELNHNKLN